MDPISHQEKTQMIQSILFHLENVEFIRKYYDISKSDIEKAQVEKLAEGNQPW
jgi:hypothetical protein|tara:strand:+ start:4277 stop:4435 length:159 start_codon:yes stop_codon:yes gene_type:complete